MEEAEKEVARISQALERFIMSLAPKPEILTLSTTFLHWAARCALTAHVSGADFKEGAAVAWKAAEEDFRAAVPVFFAGKDNQS